MRITTFYSDSYAAKDTPLLARLAVTHDLLTRLRLIQTLPVRPITPQQLQGLHDATYLDAFMHGTEPLASRQGIAWSAHIRDATLAMLGGQYQAASLLLQHNGIALNIARGFHHAHPASGSAFCPINGLALIAHLFPDKRILVLDCDEHGGNGTEEFSAILPNLYNISIFGTRFGCRGGERSWAFHVLAEDGFSHYQKALLTASTLIEDIQPNLIIYQAGADCHQKDPKSLVKLSTQELFRRDLFVFQLTKRLAIPTLFVVAGGYQPSLNVARLNANTVRAARLAWR